MNIGQCFLLFLPPYSSHTHGTSSAWEYILSFSNHSNELYGVVTQNISSATIGRVTEDMDQSTDMTIYIYSILPNLGRYSLFLLYNVHINMPSITIIINITIMCGSPRRAAAVEYGAKENSIIIILLLSLLNLMPWSGTHGMADTLCYYYCYYHTCILYVMC